MPRTVTCPRCGAENPDSLIVTVCKGCGGSLAGAKPAGAPLSQPAPPVPASPPVSEPPRREAARRSEPAPSSLPAAPAPHPTTHEPPAESAEPAFCDHCGTRNDPGSGWCARCGHRLGQRAETRQPPQRLCARCGHLQAPNRRSCESCGMHFVGAEADALAPLSRRDSVGARSEAQRAAMVVLGCVWLGFGLLMALVVVLALAGR